LEKSIWPKGLVFQKGLLDECPYSVVRDGEEALDVFTVFIDDGLAKVENTHLGLVRLLSKVDLFIPKI